MIAGKRCIECAYLAGSERTPAWIFATGRGYCNHEERRGGPWNVLQAIEKETTCARFERASDEKITLRMRGLDVLRKRLGDAYHEHTRALPSNRKGEIQI